MTGKEKSLFAEWEKEMVRRENIKHIARDELLSMYAGRNGPELENFDVFKIGNYLIQHDEQIREHTLSLLLTYQYGQGIGNALDRFSDYFSHVTSIKDIYRAQFVSPA